MEISGPVDIVVHEPEDKLEPTVHIDIIECASSASSSIRIQDNEARPADGAVNGTADNLEAAVQPTVPSMPSPAHPPGPLPVEYVLGSAEPVDVFMPEAFRPKGKLTRPTSVRHTKLKSKKKKGLCLVC
ncbi:hypothetical protein SCP_0108480 [Sparassis crispa]|uniref:Uncharacterized protein n=1 Tax=Sparassis crispa TaxID=139825 RepID=A0A401G719_9APHY|nr:hypothetical protein SCP_0108480 [Sparassis crispa]GBE77966.1 hypothetical protein SCP_0108480 [Sparassis crispa]